jgi:hypothetical protein
MDFNPIEFEFAARRCAIAGRADLFGRYVRGELNFDELGATLGIRPPKAKAEAGAGQAEQSGAAGKVGAGKGKVAKFATLPKSPSSVKDTSKKTDLKPLWARSQQQPTKPQPQESLGTALPWKTILRQVEMGKGPEPTSDCARQWREIVRAMESEERGR